MAEGSRGELVWGHMASSIQFSSQQKWLLNLIKRKYSLLSPQNTPRGKTDRAFQITNTCCRKSVTTERG